MRIDVAISVLAALLAVAAFVAVAFGTEDHTIVTGRTAAYVTGGMFLALGLLLVAMAWRETTSARRRIGFLVAALVSLGSGGYVAYTRWSRKNLQAWLRWLLAGAVLAAAFPAAAYHLSGSEAAETLPAGSEISLSLPLNAPPLTGERIDIIQILRNRDTLRDVADKFWKDPTTGEFVWADNESIGNKSPQKYDTLVDYFYLMRPSQPATAKDMYVIMLAELFNGSVWDVSTSWHHAFLGIRDEGDPYYRFSFPQDLLIRHHDGPVYLSFMMRREGANEDTGESEPAMDLEFALKFPELPEELAATLEDPPTSRETIAALLDFIKSQREKHPIRLVITASRKIVVPPMDVLTRKYNELEGWNKAADMAKVAEAMERRSLTETRAAGSGATEAKEE